MKITFDKDQEREVRGWQIHEKLQMCSMTWEDEGEMFKKIVSQFPGSS
jgi:hypothetical protein